MSATHPADIDALQNAIDHLRTALELLDTRQGDESARRAAIFVSQSMMCLGAEEPFSLANVAIPGRLQ